MAKSSTTQLFSNSTNINRSSLNMSDHNQVKITKMDFSGERPKAENPLKIQDLTFRDGQQSLFATRGRTEDMIPIAEMMDQVGFWALETWAGQHLMPCTDF